MFEETNTEFLLGKLKKLIDIFLFCDFVDKSEGDAKFINECI